MELEKVYRVKSVYHLLFVLCLVKGTEVNILILNHESLFCLYDELEKTKLFTSIKKFKQIKGFLGKIGRLMLPSVVKILRHFSEEDTHLFLCPHDIEFSLILPLAKAKKIYLIDDGEMSYRAPLEKHPLYKKKSIGSIGRLKTFFGLPYININKINIRGYYLSNPIKLMKQLPEVYNVLEQCIINFDIKEEIVKTENKRLITQVFKIPAFRKEYGEEKSIIVLTQPLVEDNLIKENVLIDKYNEILEKYSGTEYKIYIKQHPREMGNKYKKLNRKYVELPQMLPFELLEQSGFKFDIGITFFSTAMNVTFVKEKIYLYL
jgi:hypothetical protein